LKETKHSLWFTLHWFAHLIDYYILYRAVHLMYIELGIEKVIVKSKDSLGTLVHKLLVYFYAPLT